MADFVWTDEAVAALRSMVTVQGFTSRQAAIVLGVVYGAVLSRNAIIGKAARLGIAAPPRPPRAPRPPKGQPRGPYNTKSKQRRALLAPPVRLPIGIMELQNHSCRWMMSRSSYCGDPTADMLEKRPYCAYHHALAHRPR